MRFTLLITLSALLVTSCASSRDPIGPQPIAKAMASPEYQEILKGVDYYFGNQSHPTVIQEFGERKTARRSNAVSNGNDFACRRAFVSALAQLRRAALAVGANAVINIKSNYKHKEVSSESYYQCKPGALMSGVALKGTVAKLRK